MSNAEYAISQLKRHKEEVDKRLRAKLEKEQGKAKEIHAYLTSEYDKLIDYNMRGGKRLRPVFIVESYLGCGGSDINAVYDACCSIEGSEAFFLIHDDIIDRDPLRRGGPTVHVMFEKEYLENHSDGDEAKHFGTSMAMLAGDLQETLDQEFILHSGLPDDRKIAALKEFQEILKNTCNGQILDIRASSLRLEDVTDEDVLTVHKMKTSFYTIAGPLKMGCLMAGGSEEQLKAFADFGLNLGIAFQLQDDILGMYGDVSKTGKSAHSDLKEGKITLLITRALSNASEEQKKRLLELYGKKDVTDAEAEEVRSLIKETGSFDYSKKKIEELTQNAISIAEEAPVSEECKKFLTGIAQYLLAREY